MTIQRSSSSGAPAARATATAGHRTPAERSLEHVTAPTG
jgi:hypothetical protein